MTDVQAPPPSHPNGRHILAAIGNRFVVFGSGSTLRDAPRFGPDDVKERLPRVGDERDDVEQRIAHSLVVEGFEVRPVEGREFGDIELVHPKEGTILVEIRAGERDFAGVDLSRAWHELGQAGERREIWGFNLEALSLGIIWSDRDYGPGFVKLPPLDVWEFNTDGSVFGRDKVLAEVEEWVTRVTTLYDDVTAWAREEGLTALRDRTIPMSEELMQKFAVPDRDMPILDLLDGKTSVVTMKPDGLWMIGYDGMIDVITRAGVTFWLVGLPRYPEPPVWTLVDPRDRSRTPWGREAFRSVLGRVTAGE